MASIQNIVDAVSSGSSSATEQVQEALKRANDKKDFNAILSLTNERAIKRAEEIDAKIKSGEKPGRLAGVPFIAKDNFLTFGSPTTAASKILGNFETPIQATAVEKLEAEGAICIGKANLDAFAHGGSTENSAYGPTKNAFDTERVAGGSSGGSAVAVALDIVPFTLGSDTGGSIRQPASFNGVVGVKPTYGTVSRFGVVAMASSTDVIGPIPKNVVDAELIMDILAGKDPYDATTLPDFFKPQTDVGNLKIGVVEEFMNEGVDSEVLEKTNQYIEKLKESGHTVETVSLPLAPMCLAMYYIIVPAEVSSNLARYDGVRYGARAQANDLSELYGKSRDQGFEDENKRRILIGSYVLSSGYYDAYYNQAAKARTLLIGQFNSLFESYDVLVGPVTPTVAFKLGENTNDPLKMYMTDIMTTPANLAGVPALSVPAGETAEGLPVGVQLIGQRKSDAQLLALAKSMEENHG
ncbi:glutaminyl-tRNA synthase (glutamine-hydrolyzing) subunit A [Candidatus Saccharibacteria bacterium RIFCSPHIGHO2_12_FULL_42_8]|nr:MAG: glutaminyl-tRNA synthase (glutamine-hydrolyzing) subunit A [Candidatus Saccharibacteria bacterium RIFCSPHIGHO2_12_FULL_42_8]